MLSKFCMGNSSGSHVAVLQVSLCAGLSLRGAAPLTANSAVLFALPPQQAMAKQQVRKQWKARETIITAASCHGRPFGHQGRGAVQRATPTPGTN